MLSYSATKNRSLLERTQKGSLPLKKRRFLLETTTTAPITPTPTTSSTTHFWSPTSMATPSPFSAGSTAYLEVPALRSCGVSPNPGAVLAGLALIAAAANTSSSATRIPTFDPHETFCSNSSTPYCTDEKESTDTESITEELDEEEDEEEGGMTHTNEPEANSSPAAPTATCHGLTSRHHTLCRRQAGYMGSNYCKLHYQQQQLVHSKEGKIPEQKLCSSTSSQLQQHPQDKRYVEGGENERCRATTTRGRACAYVAVDGTRFCNLHADYDRNPPPRRARTKLPTSPTEEDKESLGSSLTIAPTVSTDSATNGKKPPSRIRGKHLDSPFPLLSQLSTDQWFKKKVRIGTGPWEGEIGTVEKWGNGWVSVQIEGVIGFHNRRSFELYLAEDANEQASDHKIIRRCVTREAWSPSPQPLLAEEGGSLVGSQTMHFKESHAIETSNMNDWDENGNNDVPMSPRPTPLCKNSDMMAGEETCFASETPVGTVRRVAQIRRVTPSSVRSTRTSVEIPLVDTILMSPPHHNTGVDSAKFDGSLYGTAALERGRRTIHKPSRYEDVEMLVAIKRSRRISSDDDTTSDTELTTASADARKRRLGT